MNASVGSYIRGFMKDKAFLCIAWNPWIKKKKLYIIIAVLYFKQMD